MKFLTLLTSVLFISLTTSFAQNSKKSSINILVGPSLPLGDFANKYIDNPNAGLAKTGVFLALEYDYQLSNDIYLTGRVGGDIRGIDFAFGAPTGSSLSMSTTSWKNANLFAGFSYMPKISNKLNFVVRAIGGYQYTSSPEVKINILGYFSGSSTQESVDSSSFGMLLGLGLSYNITSDIGLKTIVDYGHANPKFEVSHVSSGIVNRASTSQSIDLINIGIGISFKL